MMLSAMYENGGNTTHRFLDGHPQMLVYPFESQLGTRFVSDRLTSVFPVKYRWPVFPLHGTPDTDYEAIIDEEVRVRARTPHVSKFRDVDFDFSDADRATLFARYAAESARSTGANVMTFFRATFDAWKNLQRPRDPQVYVGYSPIHVVDTEAMLRDLPDAHLVHVVRNPWSAYADTKKRPAPMSLPDYMLAWTLNQYYAEYYRTRYPDHVHVVRIEDVLALPERTLGEVCLALGLTSSPTLRLITWNGSPLAQVRPWGTLQTPTVEANRATAGELSAAERGEIRARAQHYLDVFDYRGFLGTL